MEFDVVLLENHSSAAPRQGRLLLPEGDGWSVVPDLAYPMVCVVRRKALDPLRERAEHFVDRGVKHDAAPLSRKLLGEARIPLLEAGYSAAGRLVASARSLLDQAAACGENKPYFIGVAEATFGALWRLAALQPVGNSGIRNHRRPPGDDLEEELQRAMKPIDVPDKLRDAFIGASPFAALIRQLILHAARVEGPVLILGESGSGKEIIARQIHDQSDRSGHSFIPVNCSAISGELFESELFGHRKGAFTHAHQERKGLWQSAEGGTLFLDEIGDLSPDHQAKILRALQEGAVRPVGGDHDITVNTVVVAATNRDLWSRVKDGRFREDLYYRLRGFVIRTRPLREHPEDIRPLAEQLWKIVAGKTAQDLPDDLVHLLEHHHWQGNVRELNMVLSQLYGLFRDVGQLSARYLKLVFQQQEGRRRGNSGATRHLLDCLGHLHHVDEALRAIHYLIQPLQVQDRDLPFMDSAVAIQLDYREKEFQMLLRQPRLFYHHALAESLSRLLDALRTFHRLLDERRVKIAMAFWRDEAEAIYQETCQSVQETMQQLKQALA